MICLSANLDEMVHGLTGFVASISFNYFVVHDNWCLHVFLLSVVWMFFLKFVVFNKHGISIS